MPPYNTKKINKICTDCGLEFSSSPRRNLTICPDCYKNKYAREHSKKYFRDYKNKKAIIK